MPRHIPKNSEPIPAGESGNALTMSRQPEATMKKYVQARTVS